MSMENRESSIGAEETLQKKVVLEIGTGVLPKEPHEGDLYIGIDANYEDLNYGKNLFNERKKKLEINTDSYFLNADAQHIPIKHESVDEVVASNVFGSAKLLIPDVALHIVKNIRTVLKNGGVVKIVESYTPQSMSKLKKLFISNGFSFIQSKRTKAGFEAEGFRNFIDSGLAYLMVFKKQENV